MQKKKETIYLKRNRELHNTQYTNTQKNGVFTILGMVVPQKSPIPQPSLLCS